MNKSRYIAILLLSMAFITIAQTMPKSIKKLLNAQYAISAFYVDSVNEDKIVEDAIKGILKDSTLTPPTLPQPKPKNSTNLYKALSAASAYNSA